MVQGTKLSFLKDLMLVKKSWMLQEIELQRTSPGNISLVLS